MKIIILLNFSFPSSCAPANRYIAIGKALQLSGHDVKIVSIQSDKKKEESHNIRLNGVYEGINCRNISGITYRHNNFFVRLFFRIFGKLSLFVYTYKEHKDSKIDFVFVPTSTPLLASLFYFYSRFFRIKILMEINEFPVVFRKSFRGDLLYILHKHLQIRYHFLDGLILMTSVLQDYYRKITKNKLPTCLLPMSVDIQRFNLQAANNINKEIYVAYCGSINNKKDGVDILIKAFGIITKKHPNLKLYIIGHTSDKIALDYLKSICHELYIFDKVLFTGQIDRNEIPSLLKNAIALALARPSSIQSEGGFPTKLGEYLATHNPVIVTDVGEITHYLKDGESAYISKPDDIEMFAQKLDECLSNPDKSKTIGENGYLVALKHFDYKSQSEILNKFIINLNIKGKRNESRNS